MNKGKIIVKWSKGTRSFWLLGNALEFANHIKTQYKESPFIYDEF